MSARLFSGQHNSEQNKETGDYTKRLPRWKITWTIEKQRGEMTLLIISRENLEEYCVSAARNHKNFIREMPLTFSFYSLGSMD